MLPSAEESKAERLKRQQARFRDRGGAFVPSHSNPLVDILLARAVTGESPSKSRPKEIAAKRLSSFKARLSSPSAGIHTLSEENQPVVGRSKPKQPASRNRTSKTIELEGGEATKHTTKRRGRPAKSSKKAPDVDVEEPPPNTKPTSKGKGKQRNNHTALSTSDSNAKPKPKPKTTTKPKTTKKVVEVLSSDDDQTLVEAPQAKSKSKRRMRHEDGEIDEDTPLVTNRAILPVENSKPSSSKTIERVKGERVLGTARSIKKTLKDEGVGTRDEGHATTNAKKRSVLPEEEDEEVVPPPTKRGKSMKSKNAIEPEPMPVPRTTKDVEPGEFPDAGGRRKGKGHPNRVVAVDGDDEPRPSKPKKRKQEEDNYEDRPRKVVKFVETLPPHHSSLKLKENHSGRRHESEAKTSVKEKFEPVHPKLTAKPPLRTKTSTSKGPPPEVLERIKASAARYLRCADSEPDELDCLS